MRRSLWTLSAVLAVAALGEIDYLTGKDVSLSLFYLAPIVVAGWTLGRGPALVVAAAANGAWLLAEAGWGILPPGFAAWWNGFSRFAIFAASGVVTGRLRRDRDRLRVLLRRETGERISTLEQLRHRDRLATIGQIASGVAHELGTPLNVVSGRAKLITTDPHASAEVVENARIVHEQADRMARIIRELLDFARRRGPNPGSVDLAETARRTVELLGPVAERRGVALELAPPEAPVVAEVDRAQIQQALSNLVLNGIQASAGRGPVRVAVGRERARAPEEAGGGEAEYAFLAVADSGGGIAPEHAARI